MYRVTLSDVTMFWSGGEPAEHIAQVVTDALGVIAEDTASVA